jgi:RinA family phage transcriptional activator
MKKSVFRYIEAEIYDYHETGREIQQLREEILQGGQQEQQIRIQSSRLSDPTGRKATRLLTDRRLKRLQEVSSAIQRVIDNLPPEKRRLIEIKYWERCFWQVKFS